MRRGNGGIIGTVNAPALNANKGVWSLFEQENANKDGKWYSVIKELFSQGEIGAWYDPSDLSTVWADTAGTTPASVDGAVARIDDKSGNNNHATQATLASRPILRQSGGLTYLEFDGIDDGMSTAFIDFTSTGEISVFSGVKRVATTSFESIVNLGGDPANDNGAFGLYGRNQPGFTLLINNSGTLRLTSVTTGYPAGEYVVTGLLDINTPEQILRVDGSQVANNTDSAPATFRNDSLYIGTRSSAARLDGNLYGLIVRGASSTATEIDKTEDYLASKTGVTL
jgi:hypothetical protein